jgi:hypothetical protein
MFRDTLQNNGQCLHYNARSSIIKLKYYTAKVTIHCKTHLKLQRITLIIETKLKTLFTPTQSQFCGSGIFATFTGCNSVFLASATCSGVQ